MHRSAPPSPGLEGKELKRTHLCTAFAGIAGMLLAAGTCEAKTSIKLELAATYQTGVYDEGAAEIPAFDPGTKRAFVVNGATNQIDVLDLTDPAHPLALAPLDVSGFGSPNSVATVRGIVAVAVEAVTVTDPGLVAFYTVKGKFLGTVAVGALPDMITFTPNGSKVLVANEGEAHDGVDPEGSVSIIDLSAGITNATAVTAGFGSFNADKAALQTSGVRFVSATATVAQDLEPEYIAVSADGKKAWVTLQENNALALIDIPAGTVTGIRALGTKDHSLANNPLDTSDRDDAIHIVTWPAYGMYMPDGIAAYQAKGKTYLVTANEGDDRGETARVKDLTLDSTAFPDAASLQKNENLGRLTVSTIDGDPDGDGDYDQLFAYGARSFSIWDETGALVFDSGAAFEEITAAQLPADFNSDNAENDSFDDRSDNKGPEPEGVAIGQVNGHTFAFIGLERIGGIMVYNIDNPTAPTFVQYINNRNFAGDAEAGTAGDLGPEGLVFVPEGRSPTGTALLIVGNEVSGSTSIYTVNRVPLAN